jgi:hypothetical protein
MNFVRFRCALLGLLAGTTTACSCGKDDIAQTHATGDASPSHDARPSFPPPGDAVASGTGRVGGVRGDAFAPVRDATRDAAGDVAAVSDAEADAPHPVSEFRGDGIRDRVTERWPGDRPRHVHGGVPRYEHQCPTEATRGGPCPRSVMFHCGRTNWSTCSGAWGRVARSRPQPAAFALDAGPRRA